MAYERINWENEPSKKTPISAENLGKMDEGIAEAHEQLKILDKAVADLLYEPIVINTFVNNINTVEMGAVITDVLLSWATNKTPTELILDGENLDPALTSKELTGLEITANKSWTLRGVDEREAEAAKSTGISFLNGVYYGAAAIPDAVDSTFILGLTKTLTGSRGRKFTVNAGDEQHIWYCLPKRLGTCTFKVGGFEGGFDLVDTMEFTNASGYTEDYDVYCSGNAGLGSTTVEVS